MYNRMNFTDREGMPTFRVSDFFFSTVLSTKTDGLIDRNYIYLARNKVATEDNYLYPFDYDQQGEYYDVGKQILRPMVKTYSKNLLSQTILTLNSADETHNRSIYNFLDVLGDLGGLTECFMLVIGFFVNPISEHSFILQATKRLFVAKTNDPDLLMQHNV